MREDKPAFPSQKKVFKYDGLKSEEITVTEEGMTYREWLAGLAMQKIFMNKEFMFHGNHSKVAQEAFSMAGAMVAEASKGKE